MDNSPLRREQLVPALNDGDAELRHAALWVASRQPDWSGDVLKLIQTRMSKGELAPEEADTVRQTLVSFCGRTETQQTMAAMLGDPQTASGQRLFLLDVMDQCASKQFPA